MKRTTLLVAFMVLATAAFAHQDRILSVHADGVIPELPEAYQTTRLHVAFSEGDAGTLQQLNFLSSGRETSVQPCLLRLVSKGSFRHLFITGSWYHDESIVPHYLEVKFRDSPSPEGLPAHLGVSFLFSLRDAKLLEVERVVLIPGENTVRLQNIRLLPRPRIFVSVHAQHSLAAFQVLGVPAVAVRKEHLVLRGAVRPQGVAEPG